MPQTARGFSTLHSSRLVVTFLLEDDPATGWAALEVYIQDVGRWQKNGRSLHSLDTVRLLEGRAAAAYFDAWKGFPLKWKAADKRKVPPHWLTVRERYSPLGGSRNRHAVDPVNAMLNYAYGVLEGQCRTALLSFGFDVSAGILHADKQGRHSLLYDLMEPLRPTVDHLLLNVLVKMTFTRGDFVQTTDGACRLHPQFARYYEPHPNSSLHAAKPSVK